MLKPPVPKCRLILGLIAGALLLAHCDDGRTPTATLESGKTNCNDYEVIQEFESCTLPANDVLTSVMTWNLEQFPLHSATSERVISIIDNLRPDIIAIQEVRSTFAFNQLMNAMPLYSGAAVNITGNLELAFVFNNCKVQPVGQIQEILTDISPRPAIAGEFVIGSDTLQLINIHLKCCNDGVEQRQSAMNILKNYADSRLNEALIILGDFNETIGAPPLSNFLKDSANYFYADRSLLDSGTVYWSYPTWPSHIDHILVNRRIRERIQWTTTIQLERCVSSYLTLVSDHRPVVMAIKN